MNPKEKIAKLEGILARVRDRADAPRPHGSGARPAPSDASLRAAAPIVAPPVVAEPSPPPPVAYVSVDPAVDQNPTAPPPSMGSNPPPTTATASLSPSVTAGWSEPPPTHVESTTEVDTDDVEVSSEIVEVDIDIDEPGMMMPAESGAQPVSDQVDDAAVDAEPELDAMPTALVEEASLAPPPVDEPPPANEVQEPAPSSSPRAIASEIYEEESAPRHTPPPESGKQVTTPSVRPAAPLPSPPSAVPRSPARVPPPPPPPPAQVAPPPPPPPLAPPVARAPVRFTPEVMKPDFPSDAPVAIVEGIAPEFGPSSFGDLLDASLSL